MRRPTRTQVLAYAAAAAACALPALAGAELINGSGSADTYSWTKGDNSVFGLFTNIAKLIVTLATIVAALFIMYGGWLYLTSGGDEGKITAAHKVFKDVGVGLLLVAGAWLIVVTLLKALDAKSWVLSLFGESGS